MNMPQNRITEARSDGATPAVPADTNARKVVNLHSAYGLIKTFAIKALSRLPTRKHRDLQPGEMVPGKGIFIGELDLVDAHGASLGIKTNWYDAAIDLGQPKTFNDTADAIANHNELGRGGLRLDPARYEAELFEKLRTREAIGKHVIPPREVLRAVYELRNTAVYTLLNEYNVAGKLITTANAADHAHYQWSCTPHRFNPPNVRAVNFAGEGGVWAALDGFRLSGRACFAELAL